MYAANWDELKRKSLAEFCIDELGYRVDRKSDSRRYRALRAPTTRDEKIIVPSDPQENDHYIYFAADGSHGGTLIDLLLNVHMMTLEEVRERFLYRRLSFDSFPPRRVALPAPPKAPPSPKYSVEEVVALVKAEIAKYPLAHESGCFLGWKRGIKADVLKAFGVRGNRYSAVFPLVEVIDGELIPRTAITYKLRGDMTTKPWFLSGTPRKGSFCLLVPEGVRLDTPQEAIIFESPIDALSFYQHRREPVLYLASCGNLSQELLESWPRQLRELGVACVDLCMDIDKAGRDMERRLWTAFGFPPEAFKEKWGVDLYPPKEEKEPARPDVTRDEHYALLTPKIEPKNAAHEL